MRKTLFFMFLVSFGLILGQAQDRVSAKVQEMLETNKTVKNYEVFTKNLTQKTSKYIQSASDVTVLNLNQNELNRIVQEAPDMLSLSVPYMDKNIEVQMYRHDVLSDDFKAYNEEWQEVNYTPGKYYRGIVSGDTSSLAAISFFDNEVIGIISTWEDGNVVLGKSVDGEDYVSYSDMNLLGQNPFTCGVDDLEYNQNVQEQISFDPATESVADTDKCVRIYYEIANRPYFLKGSDLEATIDWITGIQNNISTLYDDDGVNMVISAVRVWTIKDPYVGNYSQNLSMFSATTNDFDADLGHLVNNPSTTSVAYLDSLCTTMNHAYSGVNMHYSEVPTYSWTVVAMTHEMGHSLGSPHTHACAWNGNNTAIDGCGPAAGYGEGCNGPLPEEGGTIMSYCDLVQGVGVNLLLGFGDQPAALLRNQVETKPCLGTDCNSGFTVCTYSIKEIELTQLMDGGYEVTLEDPSSTQWAYQLVPFETPAGSDWTFTDSSTFTIPGMNTNQYYDLYVANVCEGGIMGGMKKTIVLMGDFCDGTMFTDTGGDGNYRDNQYIVRTFYPTSGHAVNITFDKIRLESDKDFIYIHNGDSVDAPLFSNGTLTGIYNGGPSFTSTHSSGALTFVFVSDENITRQGWEAYVNCSEMSVSDLTDNAGIFVYPNPTDDILNIESQSPVVSYQLIDVTGRMILTKALNSNKGTLNIGHLTPGTYILNLKLKDKTVSQKVIKK